MRLRILRRVRSTMPLHVRGGRPTLSCHSSSSIQVFTVLPQVHVSGMLVSYPTLTSLRLALWGATRLCCISSFVHACFVSSSPGGFAMKHTILKTNSIACHSFAHERLPHFLHVCRRLLLHLLAFLLGFLHCSACLVLRKGGVAQS